MRFNSLIPVRSQRVLRIRSLLHQLRHTEEIIHLLKRHALCLRNEKPNKDPHRETKAREDDIRPTTRQQHPSKQPHENSPITIRPNSSQHIRHSPRDHKVKQPLRRRTKGNIQRP